MILDKAKVLGSPETKVACIYYMNLNVIPVIMVKYKSKVFEELRKKDCDRPIFKSNFLN